MPTARFVVDATSPVLQYDHLWEPGTSLSDPEAFLYDQSTFVLTKREGAKMSFNFYGSSISIIGAKRFNHGSFRASVDGEGAAGMNGSGEATPTQFNSTLYEWQGPQGKHTLVLENTETDSQKMFLDVDYLVYGVDVGKDGDSLMVSTYRESRRRFAFDPPSSWTSPSFSAGFLGGTALATTDLKASVEFTFTGDGVVIYGGSGNGYKVSYNAQVDDGSPMRFDPPPSNSTQRQSPLFIAFGLGSGSHKVKLSLAERPPPDQVLAIDFANVYHSSFDPSDPVYDAYDPQSTFPVEAKIAIGVSSTVAALCLVFALAMFFGCHFKRFCWKPKLHPSAEISPWGIGEQPDDHEHTTLSVTPTAPTSLVPPSASHTSASMDQIRHQAQGTLQPLEELRAQKRQVLFGRPPSYR